MTGIGRAEVKGYCDALVRMRRGNGSVVHVWLTDAAYIPNMVSNLISTGTCMIDRSRCLRNALMRYRELVR